MEASTGQRVADDGKGIEGQRLSGSGQQWRRQRSNAVEPSAETKQVNKGRRTNRVKEGEFWAHLDCRRHDWWPEKGHDVGTLLGHEGGHGGAAGTAGGWGECKKKTGEANQGVGRGRV